MTRRLSLFKRKTKDATKENTSPTEDKQVSENPKPSPTLTRPVSINMYRVPPAASHESEYKVTFETPEKKFLLHYIRNNIIGSDTAIEGPWGFRKITYADYTASARSLKFIEEYMINEVLPLYANTHTEASFTGLQTSKYRDEARDIIRRCVNASKDDVVVFTGSGVTACIHHLASVLHILVPEPYRQLVISTLKPEERPVVFIGPYEHHSNELIWRESIAEVVVIDYNQHGQVDLGELDAALIKYADRKLKIGSFSAASNVTGILTDVPAVSMLLHKHGALAFFDYASAGPYVQLDMNRYMTEGSDEMDYIDAMFLSPHKFLGGPGTPGVLVAKKKLFANKVPFRPGGGTVAWVSPEGQDYVPDIEGREEGGTPDIVGSIRAGIVFHVKESVGYDLIAEREHFFVSRAVESWSSNPNIVILGNTEVPRLSIVSVIIRHASSFLHHNYVVAVLNDLFGIQCRGGCNCAAPYGHRLLKISHEVSDAFHSQTKQGERGALPGWVRLNFNYFISEAEFQYIVKAVHLLANKGHRLLDKYTFNPKNGLWKYGGKAPKAGLSLHTISYDEGFMTFKSLKNKDAESSFNDYLEEAEAILDGQQYVPKSMNTSSYQQCSGEDKEDSSCVINEKLRWFLLPKSDVSSKCSSGMCNLWAPVSS